MAFYVGVDHYTQGADSIRMSACHYLFRNPFMDLYEIVLKSHLKTLDKSDKSEIFENDV